MDEVGPDGTETDQMERRETRWNEVGPDGTERDQKERRGTWKEQRGT